MSSAKLSRRATLPLSIPAQAATDDPIFAAIENHRQLFAEWGLVLKEGESSFEDNEAADAAGDVAVDAALALLTVTPTTSAGVVALLRHLANFEAACLPEFDARGIDWYAALQRHVADALEAMRPLASGSAL
jgi:hypothetical protein